MTSLQGCPDEPVADVAALCQIALQRKFWKKAARIVGATAADDIISDVAVILITGNREPFDPSRGTLEAYISVLVRSVALDYLKERRTLKAGGFEVDGKMRPRIDLELPDGNTLHKLSAPHRARSKWDPLRRGGLGEDESIQQIDEDRALWQRILPRLPQTHVDTLLALKTAKTHEAAAAAAGVTVGCFEKRVRRATAAAQEVWRQVSAEEAPAASDQTVAEEASALADTADPNTEGAKPAPAVHADTAADHADTAAATDTNPSADSEAA